jgi:transcriptional accessory protein Tex/SPT6
MKKIPYNKLDLDLYEETLDNGLRIYVIPMPNVNNFYVTLSTNYGSIEREFIPRGEKEMVCVPDGIAHFLEHKMFEQKDGKDPFAFFGERGADANANTTNFKTTYLFSGSKYLSDDLQQVLNVMKSVCIFLSHEIESHPFLRQYIWQHFKNNCYLSTEPTELGQKDIDIFSRAFRTKRLNKKPINSFNNDLYLDIIQAEKKGLIKVKIETIISDPELEKILAPLKKAYTPSNDDNNNNNENDQWKVMREESLCIFFRDEVYKQFESEIKKELEKKSRRICN